MPVIELEKNSRIDQDLLSINDLEFNFKSKTMNEITKIELVKLSTNSNNIPSKRNSDQDEIWEYNDIESMNSDAQI
jgi:hypothetical protein